ncbi:hypothetical protein EGW08_016672 [Elysia chlorotica]|uniref:Uncharacterized protein n=1 Tax=Elysia chlorotica TaxID=188477 RepID=A0A3S1B5P8_ELYCH|nr:hypothetical protein EGW08_016672 [Elysia chlorotica]
MAPVRFVVLFWAAILYCPVTLTVAMSLAAFDNCSGHKPFFCAHNVRCFSHDQYCDPGEDKIQECLPNENPLNWCIINKNNVEAMPDDQCKFACWYRYNQSQLEPLPPETSLIPSTLSPIVSNNTQNETCSSKDTFNHIPPWLVWLSIIEFFIIMALCIVLLLMYKRYKKFDYKCKSKDIAKKANADVNYEEVDDCDPNELQPLETSVDIRRDIQLQASERDTQQRGDPPVEVDHPQQNSVNDSPSTSSTSGYTSSPTSDDVPSITDAERSTSAQQEQPPPPHGQSSSATQLQQPRVSCGIPSPMPRQDETGPTLVAPSGQYRRGELQ